MTTPLPKLVSQRFNGYNKITLIDNITSLPIPNREDQDIVILRITEKEIGEAFPELVPQKKHMKKKRPLIESHLHQK